MKMLSNSHYIERIRTIFWDEYGDIEFRILTFLTIFTLFLALCI